jgi:hypothetical protein
VDLETAPDPELFALAEPDPLCIPEQVPDPDLDLDMDLK